MHTFDYNENELKQARDTTRTTEIALVRAVAWVPWWCLSLSSPALRRKRTLRAPGSTPSLRRTGGRPVARHGERSRSQLLFNSGGNYRALANFGCYRFGFEPSPPPLIVPKRVFCTSYSVKQCLIHSILRLTHALRVFLGCSRHRQPSPRRSMVHASRNQLDQH